MIGKISGKLIQISADHIIVDVHGLGYEVFLSERTLGDLPSLGETVSVFTELIVREDLLQLVGFRSVSDREWYRLLTSVQGVGSKAALKIMGTITSNAISRAILMGDSAVITAAQGVGPKIAQRIITELKDKAAFLIAQNPNLEIVPETNVLSDKPSARTEEENLEFENQRFGASGDREVTGLEADAVSALSNLGYSTVDAAQALATVLTDRKVANVEELIKLALKQLAPKG